MFCKVGGTSHGCSLGRSCLDSCGKRTYCRKSTLGLGILCKREESVRTPGSRIRDRLGEQGKEVCKDVIEIRGLF